MSEIYFLLHFIICIFVLTLILEIGISFLMILQRTLQHNDGQSSLQRERASFFICKHINLTLAQTSNIVIIIIIIIINIKGKPGNV